MIRFLQTPGRTKKLVLGGLLLVICAAMVITLVPGGSSSAFGFGGPGAGVIAKVGGSDVTALQVQQTAKMMIRQQFPKGGAQAAALMPFFASRAAEQLINQKALVEEARRMGLHATDEELRDELQHGQLGQYFFPSGNFIGAEAYEEFVTRNFDMSVPQFEQEEKDGILLRKLRAMLGASAIVTDAEIRQDFDRKNVKVKFQYAVLSLDDIKKSLNPGEEELKAFYDRNKANYTNSIPEKRKVKYALLDSSRIQAQTQVTPADVQAYYQQHQDEYRVPEQVKVSHILVKTPLPGADGKVDEKGVEAARKKAEDLLKQVKAGGNFEEIAKKNSEDTGSAAQGGSLGLIGRGRTVPEFEKTAFSLPKGQISDLVKSSYGFHIIRVDDKQDAHVKPLPEVRDQIESTLKQQKSAGAVEAAANKVTTQARTQSLEKAAAANGLQIVTPDYFGRSETLPVIGNSPQFMDAVFSAKQSNPPDMVQTPQGYAIYQVEDVKPPATPAFADIRQRVMDEFKNERAATLLTQKTQEMADRAKAEHDLAKAAKESNAVLKTSDLVAPDGQVPEIGSLAGPASAIFALKAGEISGPISTNGKGVVAQVQDKQQATEAEFAQKKDQIREALLSQKQNELFEMFVGNVRDQMEKSGKIKVNKEELNKLSKAPNEEG